MPARRRQMSFEDLGTPLAEATLVVVDLETTGTDPSTDGITEIGAVKVRGGEVLGEFRSFVDPQRPIPAYVAALTGISDATVRDAPVIGTVLPMFLDFVGDAALVAHNARFDVGFLTQALGRRERLARGARVPRVCTMEWARHYITTPSRRLTTCCEVSGVEIGHHHSALDDARASAGLLRHYMGIGAQRGEEPVAWARALADARAFTGWTWDEAAAEQAESLLAPRRGPGVPREGVPDHL